MASLNILAWRVPGYGDVLGQVESTSELPLVELAPGESVGAGTYCYRLGVSLRNRTTLVKEVFPKRLSSARAEQWTRPRTFSYVFISYGCSSDWAKKAANAELTQTWKALEAEEISRPIAHEEIVCRQADEFLAVVYHLDAVGELEDATDRLFDHITGSCTLECLKS